jgi:hypothetical protein
MTKEGEKLGVEELPTPVRVKVLELAPGVKLDLCDPLNDGLLRLSLVMKEDSPPVAGVVIHNGQVPPVPAQCRRERADEITVDAVKWCSCPAPNTWVRSSLSLPLDAWEAPG